MALHTDTPIYKATYDLSLLVTRLVANMPRNYKADFGQRLREQCFDLVMAVYRANTAADRAPELRAMRGALEAACLSLRLAADLRLISRGQYAQSIEIAGSIGKQLTGWLRNTESRLSPARQGGRANAHR